MAVAVSYPGVYVEEVGSGVRTIAGVQFAWVTWHWMAGLVLTASILFHVIHASFWLDFWSIWVGPRDMPELKAEVMAR